ncbi:MAG: GNAT family N-acetyltransferase [Rhodobacterales bacterium RIFCSPHIGHO2_02_FULL_62_130]|jgi:phosphinothricin acetyltransferase|nr:MAG: GNAT family N-acetyltransferase [Rhodobacterales bacterium RIFCSPHIGHO2_02_FULL_62_130]OHC57240.1 MAG: GNAT family N-acetyltransferase [Rhodobacterales bacterium RIFCSPHIGHO2_12_FULL_62_75]HCZ01389.1 GNAT family N-acetyltransferase [Rhodobacter sp.]
MIRPATFADAAALADLWNPWIRDTAITFNAQEKSPDDIARMIADRNAAGHAFLVAEADGLLGFVTYSQFRGGVGYATCMEHTVVLSPQARGRGVGRALMQAIEDHARSTGAHQMIAGVSGENAQGRAFHASLGYREIATVPEAGYKFGRFIDLVLMQKFLT